MTSAEIKITRTMPTELRVGSTRAKSATANVLRPVIPVFETPIRNDAVTKIAHCQSRRCIRIRFCPLYTGHLAWRRLPTLLGRRNYNRLRVHLQYRHTPSSAPLPQECPEPVQPLTLPRVPTTISSATAAATRCRPRGSAGEPCADKVFVTQVAVAQRSVLRWIRCA